MTYETKYELGEVVYTSSAQGTDKVFIEAIKLTGKTKPKIVYGVKSGGGSLYSMYLWGGDGYNWYTSKELFKNAQLAESNHKKLKAEQEAKEEKEKLKNRQKEIIEARARLEKLEAGIDPDEDWED